MGQFPSQIKVVQRLLYLQLSAAGLGLLHEGEISGVLKYNLCSLVTSSWIERCM